jgi:hypothetical protein
LNNLLLAGHYQNSVTLQRDLSETGFFIDYLAIEWAKIREWKGSNDKERKEKFAPVKVLAALEAHDKAPAEREPNLQADVQQIRQAVLPSYAFGSR